MSRCQFTLANRSATLVAALLTLAAGVPLAQQQVTTTQQTGAPQSAATEAAAPQSDQSTEPAPPRGKVLFSRSVDDSSAEVPAVAEPSTTRQNDLITDAEHRALTFIAYDLDVHLTPASASIAVRAGLTVRNDSAAPLSRLTLQISSSLHWDAISERPLGGGSTKQLSFTVGLINTDADHTGVMSEAVVALQQPLDPGASLTLDALYSGAIPPSAERLERIGAPDDQAQQLDWDAIGSGSASGTTGFTALRGFGNVLWIPVSAPSVLLGDGDRLAQLAGAERLRQSAATIRLRLAVEYVGDPPDAAFFCGRRQSLKAIDDNVNLPDTSSPGIATALFEAEPLGFRSPSLFVTGRPASVTGTPANPALLSVITDHYDALPAYSAAAALVEPLITDWLGARPLTPLTLIDHAGQPFEDDALVVRPMRTVDPATLTPALVHSLTHSWIRSNYAWIDEGLAQFFGLLWIERNNSRVAALDALQTASRSLALAEPQLTALSTDPLHGSSTAVATGVSANDSSSQSSNSQSAHMPAFTVSPAGENLVAATGDVFFRTKAAAVWWMLRDIVGDEALKQALDNYRQDAALDRDPMGLERVLEKSSHKNLRWFFDDWVYHDRGLPALTIVNVTPTQLTSRDGLPAGWLVPVEVRNDGAAEVEVPITVQSSSAKETRRLRIAGRSSVSTRIIFTSRPEQVEVNDGSIPEAETSIHSRQILLPAARPDASHPPSR